MQSHGPRPWKHGLHYVGPVSPGHPDGQLRSVESDDVHGSQYAVHSARYGVRKRFRLAAPVGAWSMSKGAGAGHLSKRIYTVSSAHEAAVLVFPFEQRNSWG